MTKATVPEGSRAVLIGVSAYEYPEFPSVRAARNSTQAMHELLSDPALCGWVPEQITVISNPDSAETLAVRIADLAERTAGVLLLYYVGHGRLTDVGELCLTVTSTRPDRPKISGLPWSTVADVLRACPARTRLVILDCCFAGQAIEALNGADGSGLGDIAHVQGVYTLTATTRNRTAHVPPPDQQGTTCTSFTGELADLIRTGIPGGPAQLTFGDIYPFLRQRLDAKGLPAPSQRGTDTAHQFRFSANAAHIQDETSRAGEEVQTIREHIRADTRTAPELEPADEVRALLLRPQPASHKPAKRHKAREPLSAMFRRGRREPVIGGAITIVIAAVLLATLWPGSPLRIGAGQRADAAMTRGASLRGKPATSGTPTRPAPSRTPHDHTTQPTPSRTPHEQATRHVTNPVRGSTPAPAPPTGDIEALCAAVDGGPVCIALYNFVYGNSEVLGVAGASATIGQPADLQSASGSNKAEDWEIGASGTVSSFYQAGVVSAGLSQQYGEYNAFEFEYAPFGNRSGMCLGVSGTAQNGIPVTLQPCGAGASTLWVLDNALIYIQYVPLINATTTDYTQPLVLTVNSPGANATVSNLTQASGGTANGQYWRTEH